MSVLVAGLGNVLLRDDGFGVEVARLLGATPLSADVRVVDFGVRGLHLAFELLEPYDAVVLIDAVARGAAPGTLFVIAPEDPSVEEGVLPDAHAMHPATVLRMARELGAPLTHVRIVGCEPETVDEGIGLSAPAARATVEAVRIVQEILAEVARHGAGRDRGRRARSAGGEDDDADEATQARQGDAGGLPGAGGGRRGRALDRARGGPVPPDQDDVMGATRSTSST